MTASSQGGVGAAGQCPQEHGPDAPATPRDRWLRAAVILWVVFGIAVGIKAFVPPGAEQHSVYPTFSEAARRWYADEPLYGDHGFYNSPALAAALAPLALLRDAYGGVLWGALNLGLLFAALRAFFRQVLAPLRPGLCEGQSRMSSSSPARDRPSSAFCDRWIWGLLLLGVAVRSVRYLLRFPLCADETLLAVNFLDRGYLDLLRPLDYAQVAPLLFLWAELTVIKLLGFSEYSLRLLPFVCSLASLLLFRRLVRLLLRGSAAVLAVAIFAVSYSCIRYSAEAKPYGSDVLVSLVLLTLAVRWWRTPGENRWLWLLTALAPLAVGLSYPAVFVAGGVSLAVAAVLWSSSVRRGWRPWLAYNAALAASFGGLYLLCTRGQAQAELELMVGLWQSAFPPLDSIGRFLAWLAAAHTGSLVAQPIGGEHYGSTLTFLLCAVGMAALVRRGRYRLLLLCAAPPALNFLAALLRRYPYGGHVRLAMYLAPIVCLLAGLGAAVVLEAFRRRPQVRRGSPDPAAARPQVSEGGETFGRRCGSVGDRPQHGGGSVGDRPQHGDRPLRGESTGETPVPPRRAFEDVRALVPASPRPRVSASR
ncbi:MAG: glycosyltransferase family 39 protein, partial [Thermoguttaceae bacterium]